jgi:putative phage-type endonuclease
MTDVMAEPVEIANLDDLTRDEWLELRRGGIGGSDAGAILGVNPWTPPVQVWGEKLGITPPSDDNESMFWGRRLETAIAEVFAERHPELDVWADRRMLAHPGRPWMFANPDRRIGESEILELKTADRNMVDEWAGGPPLHYQCQVQHYCEVLGAVGAWVAVLLGGNRYREFYLHRDDALIATLVDIEERFWTENVLAEQQPSMVGTEAEAAWLSDTYGGNRGTEILLPPDAMADVGMLLELKESIGLLEDDKRLVENRLKAVMGDATEGIDPDTGRTVITWRPHTQKQLDVAGFAARHPYSYQRLLVDEPRRPFKTPKPKKEK